MSIPKSGILVEISVICIPFRRKNTKSFALTKEIETTHKDNHEEFTLFNNFIICRSFYPGGGARGDYFSKWMSEKKVDILDALFHEKAEFVHMGGSWGKDQELDIIKSWKLASLSFTKLLNP